MVDIHFNLHPSLSKYCNDFTVDNKRCVVLCYVCSCTNYLGDQQDCSWDVWSSMQTEQVDVASLK